MRLNDDRRRLREVARVFGWLGLTAFGGPAAHVALQEEECVGRRGWLDRQRFLDLLAATNLIPGPNSTEMAMHLGWLRAGWPGLVVGGVAFILPSAVLVGILAAAYVHWGQLPSATAMLAALRPAVLVVVANALRRFARQAVHDVWTATLALAALALALGGASEVLLVLLAALVGLAAPRARAHVVPLLQLAWVFTKIGATLFGSGYVLIAYLRTELGAHGWLDDARLLDAIAIGQLTPGPVSTAATFVGYLLAGPPGALVATVAIFLPGFVLVAATAPMVERWRSRPAVRRTLDAVNATVVGLIAAVVVRLAPAALADRTAVGIAAAAAGAVFGLGIPGTAVMLGASTLGLVRAFLLS